MRLFLKQKLLSFSDRYRVVDEDGWLLYSARKSFFAWPSRLLLKNAYGEVIYTIKRTWMPIYATYQVYQDQQWVATIEKDSYVFQVWRVILPDKVLQVQSEYHFLGREAYYLEVRAGDTLLAMIDKKFFAIGDSYTIDLEEAAPQDLVMALVLAIDNSSYRGLMRRY